MLMRVDWPWRCGLLTKASSKRWNFSWIKERISIKYILPRNTQPDSWRTRTSMPMWWLGLIVNPTKKMRKTTHPCSAGIPAIVLYAHWVGFPVTILRCRCSAGILALIAMFQQHPLWVGIPAPIMCPQHPLWVGIPAVTAWGRFDFRLLNHRRRHGVPRCLT